MKESCGECKYLYPNKGTKYYKCYGGDCPAKLKEDKKRQKLRKKVLSGTKKKY